MAKSNQDANNITQTQLDNLETPIIIPTGKLDADQYSADDLDGVTESLFGSGNMAYGILQAGQTNEILQNSSLALNTEQTSTDNGNLSQAVNPNASPPEINNKGINDHNPKSNNGGGTNTDRSIETSGNFGSPVTNATDNSYATSTVGSLGASQLSSDAGSFSSNGSNLNLESGLNGNDGTSGQDGTTPKIPEVKNGQDGTNGTNGSDGTGGGKEVNFNFGDTIINFGDIDIDLGDTIEILDGLFIDLGDTITTVSIEITNIIQTLGDIITNIDILDLDNVTHLVTNITNNLTDIVNDTVTEIASITNNVTNILQDILDGKDGALNLTLDLDVLNTVLTDINIPLNNILDTDVNLDVSLDPAVNLVNGIADLTGLDILNDTLGELGGTVEALQSTIDQVTDIVTDLDLNDPGASVEQLIGTLENLDQTTSGIITQLDDAVGGILENIGLGDGPLAELPLSQVDGLEDGVEAITGNLESLTDGILDVFGNDNGDDNEGLISQTFDPVINNTGDIVDALTGGATNDLTDTLDNVADGLTDIADDLTGGLIGNILGQNNNNQDGNGDSDIGIDLGIEPLDINEGLEVALDPVEDLLGDIDIGINLNTDLFDTNNSETDNYAGDTDITIETGIDLVDNTVLQEGLDIPLDPVEQITGDIDLNTDVAVDLLNNLADPLANDAEGGSGEDTLLSGIGDTLGETVESILNDDLDIGDALNLLDNNNLFDQNLVDSGSDETSWTESTVGESGLFDDLIDGLGGADDILPDPAGTIAEGLGALDIDPEINIGSLGGLFG